MPKYGKKRNAVRDKLLTKEKCNPFEIHFNRSKYDVIGRQSKDDRGLPGVSRSKAIKKRERTLLKEYKDRHKAGKFVDRRIGEHNPFMDPEQKMLLRMAAEKRHTFSKKNIFNLNDEEELTHKGKALTETTIDDRTAFSDDDDDDDMLDADFVKDKHFGGDFLTRKKDEPSLGTDKPKTRKEWIDDIIAESKRKKAESRKEKDEQEEAVSKLNSQYESFLKLMVGKTLTDEDKAKCVKNADYKSYDTTVKEIMFDRTKRSKPTDRLKSEEELAREKKEKLEQLEADRQRRMKGEDDEGASQYMALQSADALNDEFYFKEDKRFHVSYKDGEILTDKTISSAINVINSKSSVNDIKNKAEEEADSINNEDSDDNENEESDQYSDILESSSEDDDDSDKESEGRHNVEENNDNKNGVTHLRCEENMDSIACKTKGNKRGKEETKINGGNKKLKTEKTVVAAEVGLQRKAAQIELPFTFEVPNDYEGFWNLIKGRTPLEFSTIIERMLACSHPSLDSENKIKCTTLFAYLLQTLHTICSVDPEPVCEGEDPFSYINPMIPILFKLVRLSPPDCASSLTQVIDEKYQDYISRSKRYPFADTFIFLKVAGLMFPASDYHHEVMTRVVTILTQFLGESRVTSRREITCLLFTSALLHEYLKRCGRFIGELSNALRGILYLSIPTDESKLQLPYTLPFRRVGTNADLLVLKEKVQTYDPPNLSLSSLNINMDMTEQFKICAVHESIRILKNLSKTWAQLPSVGTLFSLVTKLLTKFPIQNYPEETQVLFKDLQQCISELPSHPKPLAKDQGGIKTLRMLEPKIEEVVEGMRKRRGTKEYEEKQKLLHKVKRERKAVKRELRRDASFLAREQLKEVLRHDAIRKKKVNLLMQGLATQENECKKFKNSKK